MPDIEVNIEIYCAGCGEGICGNATVTQIRRQPCFQIEPCEKCLKRSYNEGYQQGKDEAE